MTTFWQVLMILAFFGIAGFLDANSQELEQLAYCENVRHGVLADYRENFSKNCLRNRLTR